MSFEGSSSFEHRYGMSKLIRGSGRRLGDFLSGIRRKFYGPITHVRMTSNHAALTFDDGPHPEFTVALLRILRQFGVKATFFMVGEVAARYPEVVRMVAEDGHVIGNHSHSHRAFPELDREGRRTELELCARTLYPYENKLFRPPFGRENLASHRDAVNLGYRVIGWNLSVDDWRQHSADRLAERLMQGLRPGSIVLLHDSRVDDPASSRAQTLKAVEDVLGRTSGKFSFLTVPELLAMGRPMSSNFT